MKQPLCWLIEIHWGELNEESRGGSALVLSCHITGWKHSERNCSDWGSVGITTICWIKVTWKYFISAGRTKKKKQFKWVWVVKKNKRNSRNKGFQKKHVNLSHYLAPHESLSQVKVWTEDGSGVKLADRVILSGRHAAPLIVPEPASFFLFIKKC